MKIKTDFVTNSSSSSFVAIGAWIEPDDLSIDFDKMQEEHFSSWSIEELKNNIGEVIDQLLQGTDLTYATTCYDSNIMIGMPYTKMRDDETLRMFKNRAKTQFEDVLGIDITPSHMEECWMDG